MSGDIVFPRRILELVSLTSNLVHPTVSTIEWCFALVSVDSALRERRGKLHDITSRHWLSRPAWVILRG